LVEPAIPRALAAACATTPERAAWLARLPDTLSELERRWSLKLAVPFEGEASCSWVAPVTLAGGAGAVLKLGMPHIEGEHEIDGLRFWNGDPTVRLLEADDDAGATGRTIPRFADLLGLDHERVRLWTFARAAAEPRDDWAGDGLLDLARAIAP
jgi:hypothetical protein